MVGYDLNDGSLFNYIMDTQNLWSVYNMVPVHPAKAEVPQPDEPATPAVPDAPITPAVPDPGTPTEPEQPATVPTPDEPATPIAPNPDPDRDSHDAVRREPSRSRLNI